MSAERLREAAAAMREDWPATNDGADAEIPTFYAAVADWLDGAAARADMTSDARLRFDAEEQAWFLPALAVANAYLGGDS